MRTKVNYEFNAKQFWVDIRGNVSPGGLREVAVHAGVSASTLSRISNGEYPSMDNFMTICSRLELKPSDYFVLVTWTTDDLS